MYTCCVYLYTSGIYDYKYRLYFIVILANVVLPGCSAGWCAVTLDTQAL